MLRQKSPIHMSKYIKSIRIYSEPQKFCHNLHICPHLKHILFSSAVKQELLDFAKAAISHPTNVH